MKVTQEQLPNSQVGLQIEIPAELSKTTYEKVLQKLIKTANIPGFRRGKIPRQVFLQRFGIAQVKAAVLEELIQSALDQALEQESIQAIGNYQLQSTFEELIQNYTPGEPLTFKASVDVSPQVTLKQYTGLEIQAEAVEYQESRVDEVLEQYRLNLATLVPIEDRPAAMGDVAVVDFAGKVQQADGSYASFEGGDAEDFQVELKEGGFIEGFVEGIVGMSLDETKEIELTFPEDYPQETLAGKPAIFSVTLKELKEKELPDLDDDLAQEISEFETLDALRQSLEERYRQEAEEKTKDNEYEAILKALLDHLEADIPETLIRREANHLVSQAVAQLGRQGLDIGKMLTPELVERMQERSRPDAIDRLKRTLALAEVAKQESITVDEAAVKARMEDLLQEVRNPQEVDQERLEEVVQEELLQEEVLEWLRQHNTLTLVPEGTLTDTEDMQETATEQSVATRSVEAPESAAAATVDVEATDTTTDTPTTDTAAETADTKEA